RQRTPRRGNAADPPTAKGQRIRIRGGAPLRASRINTSRFDRTATAGTPIAPAYSPQLRLAAAWGFA
ncbi:MAG TPA: hypothetical protein VN541_09670, partial [Tepidisphaeraceae bacterium]|nr:hypothetical protein [Tepidisphaeraceae bacterium]